MNQSLGVSCNFLHLLVTSFLSGPNSLLSTLFSPLQWKAKFRTHNRWNGRFVYFNPRVFG